MFAPPHPLMFAPPHPLTIILLVAAICVAMLGSWWWGLPVGLAFLYECCRLLLLAAEDVESDDPDGS